MPRILIVAGTVFAVWLLLTFAWFAASGRDLSVFLTTELTLPTWLVLLKLLVVGGLISRRFVRRAADPAASASPTTAAVERA